MTRRGGVAWLCAAIAVAATTVALWRIQPQIGFDAGLGLISCEQRLAGRPNSLREMTLAESSDLTHDTFEVITWWAPGQQMIFCAVRQSGLSFDSALRGLVLGAWFVGMGAWALYFVRVLGPTEAAAWTIGLFALFRQSHAGVLIYTGGEALLWALCPVVVLVNLRGLWPLEAHPARSRPHGLPPLVWAAAGGAAAVLLVVIKYSAALIMVGLAVAWIWSVWRRDVEVRQLVAWCAGAAIGVALLIAAGLAVTGSGGTPATAIATNPMGLVGLWVIAGPMIGLSGTLSAMQTLGDALHLHALRFDLDADEQRALAAAAIAWIVLIGIWWRATRPVLSWTKRWVFDGRLPAWRIAASIAVSTSAGLAVLLARGATISFEDRHLQYGGFLLFPFLVRALARAWALRQTMPRALTAMVALMAIGLPAANGAASLLSQAFIRPPDAPRPAALSVDRVIAADLDAQPWVAASVLATPPNLVPVSRPAQRLRWVMDFEASENAVYRGMPAGGIALLVPTSVSDAYAAALRSGFHDVRTWERVPLDHSTRFQLWRGR